MNGTSGKNAIQGYGGFNFSEHNTQLHRPRNPSNDYSEQDHLHKQYSGRNPLNNPAAGDTSTQKLKFGQNADFDWRERTLPGAPPGQVAGGFGRLPFSSADTSLLQWKLAHGYGQNDPSLEYMLDERGIAPKVRADWTWQSDPFLHSDIGVPSVVNQNMMERPTVNIFPADKKQRVRGKHDHTNLKEHHTPSYWNDSNTGSGTHHTYGGPPNPVTNGFRATRGPLERPLLLSDLPAPPQPMTVI